jgi:hypothetical protein
MAFGILYLSTCNFGSCFLFYKYFNTLHVLAKLAIFKCKKVKKGKVKLSLCLTKHYVMETYG